MNKLHHDISPLLTAKDVAVRLKVSLSWLAKARMRGDGPPYICVGRSIRYAETARNHASACPPASNNGTPTKMCQEAIDSAQVLASSAGMNIYLNTSVYMNRNEVECRLGTYTEVLVVGITLTYSQNAIEYTLVHPHPSQASRCRSQ